MRESERGERKMEDEVKSRVMKVDSKETWSTFVNEAKTQEQPLVVHFTAAWCMPSVVMNHIYEELAWMYPDVVFLLVDVDDVKEVASKMEIKAMPTFLMLKNGDQVVDKLVGANPDETKKRIGAFLHSTS